MGEFGIAGTWRLRAPVDDVWAVVSDLRRWEEWWTALRDVEERDDGLVRLTFDTPARPLRVDVAVEELVAPERIVVRSARGGLQGSGEMVLSEADGTTSVAYRWDVRTTSIWLKPVEPFLRAATRSGGGATLDAAGERLARMVGGDLLASEH